ncbi:hypothetical protein [Rhizobium hidalgonense]|uniref:hypothetical protein n=1 Tax=Rhizobium hidalgonense TaxID=1538159 RepID=UPI0035C6F203
MTTTDLRALFEAAVVARMKDSGFLEIEIRTECLVRCDDGYQDEVINAGWHYWNAALSGMAAASAGLADPCPRPANHRPDILPAAACIAAGECGCGAGARKFNLGDRVSKATGSSWNGHIVGFYSTELTPIGYCVESEREPGSVHIYPEAALRTHAPVDNPCEDRGGNDQAR